MKLPQKVLLITCPFLPWSAFSLCVQDFVEILRMDCLVLQTALKSEVVPARNLQPKKATLDRNRKNIPLKHYEYLLAVVCAAASRSAFYVLVHTRLLFYAVLRTPVKRSLVVRETSWLPLLLPQLKNQLGPDSRRAWLLQLIIAGLGLPLAADRRTGRDAAANVAIFHFLEKLERRSFELQYFKAHILHSTLFERSEFLIATSPQKNLCVCRVFD